MPIADAAAPALLARGRLPEHRHLRAAAAHGVRGPHGGRGRVAPRRHRLRRLGSLRRRRPRELRAAGRRRRRRRRGRPRRLAFAGLVAAALPAGARVLAPRRTSRACCSRSSPRRRAACASSWCRSSGSPTRSGPEHDLVAVSAVQSADGRIADLDALAAAAAAHGARTFVDTTQGIGWLPLDCSPLRLHRVRGLQVAAQPARHRVLHRAARAARRLIPHAAGWYAGEDVPASYYGAPLRLATDARRFDLSPAWLNWVAGAAVARAAGGGQDRGDRRARPAMAGAAARRLGLAPGTPRSCPWRAARRRGGAAARRGRDGGRPRRAPCGSPATSTRPSATSTARSRCSPSR